MQNTRKTLLFITSLLLLTACNESSGESSKAEHPLEQTTAATTTSETSSTSKSSTSQTTPSWEASWLTRVTPELPTQFPEVNATCADGFRVSDYVSDPSCEGAGITAVDGETILFSVSKDVRVGAGAVDASFFKYDTKSKKVTMLEGVVRGLNVSSGDRAIANGKLYEIWETQGDADGSWGDRIHYAVDYRHNRVEILQQEPVADETGQRTRGFYSAYPVNDSEYVETWFRKEWVGDKEVLTDFAKWYHADGSSEELLPNAANSDRTISVDTTNDNKIYDIRLEGEDNVLYVYDMQLQMLSRTPMPELTAVLRELKERYNMEYVPIRETYVFGDYVGFDLGDGSDHTQFLYNKAIGKVFTLEDWYYCSTNRSVGKDIDCHLFYRIDWDAETEKSHTEIFSIDNAGNISAVMELDGSGFCTDGKTLAYLKDGALYYITL